MKATGSSWHFPREDLAQRVLRLLTDGPGTALALFAPRRTGKTEFLSFDLAPAADELGHRVVYASFWEAPAAPLAVLLHALEDSLRRGRWSDRVRENASALAPKLRLSAPLPGVEAAAEVDLGALKNDVPSELLLYLGDLVERVSNERRPTLLLLDEVQELAREPSTRPLIAALRTALDVNKAGLRTVFTGSSQQGLQAMFSDREAPFFHFATPLDLPALERPFVEHLIDVARGITERTIDLDEALEVFESLHANPYFFRLVIETLVLHPDLDIARAAEQVRVRVAARLGYTDVWLSLDPLQRALVRALADGVGQPFSATSRATLGRLLDGDVPTASRVQTAMKTLARRRIVDEWDGRRVLADPAFAVWARERDVG